MEHVGTYSDLLLHAIDRLRSSYIGWMRRASNHGQQQGNVIQLHATLRQLQADSINDAQVVIE